ncbi:hypothetical protein [Cellulomonas xiejunii]|uniref:hypothetical protein n=1 Tax=Cellulomonas xiejunii TaxID=2968083 RepID=UPI001D0F3101|nr:hypothetical protein [Cellulomonas xiejunii]MCC2314346.1 hypothetical protein [Cellulomonas xiejunii]
MSIEPADLAPHVETTWADDFVVELRLRDVPGDVIGDLLTEVESHVVDSGTPAHEAFGDPTQYAAQIAETAARPDPDAPGELVPIAIGAAAMVVAVGGVVEWWQDGTFELTGGTVALVLGVLLAPFVIARFFAPLVRFVLTAPWWKSWLLAMAALVPMVGLAVLARPWHIGTLPAPPVAVGALVLLAVAIVLELRHPSPVDPLLAPGADRATADEAARRDARRTTLLVWATQVGWVAAAAATGILINRLAG